MSSTTQLQDFIHRQVLGGIIDLEKLKKQKYEISKAREQRQKTKLDEIKSEIGNDPLKLRLLESSCERVASNWLTCLPIEVYGFSLNKQEFKDAICLRYRWALDRILLQCPCGSQFSVNHAMASKKGGFIHARHNEIRDMTASILK